MNLQSGYPYSLIKSGLMHAYPKLTRSLKTDVVIIGGGISGALTAYHLNNAGIDCVIVDGRTIGLGSTCASTSLLQYEIDIPLVELAKIRGEEQAVRSYRLCKEAIEKLESLAKKIGFKEFNSKHSLYFAAHKKDIEFLKQEFAIRKANGFNVAYLGEEDIKKNFGFISQGAILSKHGAQTDAYLFTHHLLQHAISNGLQVYDRTFIKDVKTRAKDVLLTTAEGLTITAGKVVYATGYETTEIVKKKIVKLHSTYATISENNTETVLWKDTLLWNTADPYLYMRCTDDNRILVGGRDEKFYNPVKRDKLLNQKTKLLIKDFKKLFPKGPFKNEFSWTGTFGATEDGLPFIGNYAKLPHSYFALGFGGNGITFSLIAAEIIIDIFLGKKNEDAHIFAFDRV